jgi:predicted nicotinamide N-methyase
VKTDPARFIRDNTSPMAPPHVPEISLHLATEAHELWLKTEEELAEIGLPPPFWAFAWAGGQGLARYVLDHPETVAGKRVVDFASGSGLVAIAAMMAGAKSVLAADIDPWTAMAVELNAGLNNVEIGFTGDNLIGCDIDADVACRRCVLRPRFRRSAGALVRAASGVRCQPAGRRSRAGLSAEGTGWRPARCIRCR